MDRFTLLPKYIKQKIYELDNTFKEVYDICLAEMIVNVLEDVLFKRQRKVLSTQDFGSTRVLDYYEGEATSPSSDGYLCPTNIVRQIQEKSGDDSLVQYKKTLERMCSIKYTAVSNHLDEFNIKSKVMKPETIIKKCEKQLKNHNVKNIMSYYKASLMYDDDDISFLADLRTRKRDDMDRLHWLHNDTCVGGYMFPELYQYGKLCKLLAILNHDLDLFNFEESQPDVDWIVQVAYDDDEVWEEFLI